MDGGFCPGAGSCGGVAISGVSVILLTLTKTLCAYHAAERGATGAGTSDKGPIYKAQTTTETKMSSSMIEFILLAAIAVFIGWRLYVTLGQDNGPPDGKSRNPVANADPRKKPAERRGEADIIPMRPNFTGPAAGGLEDIHAVDSNFDPRTFMQGARAAYEMIVAAYGRGDRDALKPLLDTDVYEAWDAAITEREQTGAEGMQLLRIRKADITEASLGSDGMARVIVHFESELGDGERAVRAEELWTFMRQTRNDDPNWLLDDVDTAA